MLGQIEYETKAAKLPQKAASAFSAAGNLVGASYQPLLYLGKQLTKGTDYLFIAEQTTVTKTPEKHVVFMKINEFESKYRVVYIQKIV